SRARPPRNREHRRPVREVPRPAAVSLPRRGRDPGALHGSAREGRHLRAGRRLTGMPGPVEITNLLGVDDRLVAGAEPTADETAFQLDNTSERYYQSPYYEKHKLDLQQVPRPRAKRPRMQLDRVLPARVLEPIVAAKRISFHSVGDTGAARVNRYQT